ncbi:hypothetical protein NMD1_00006 [Novosphingobium sp. MD-1]|nr:hypothetical protein NMD1_00006 [Novosphingobium sp. MD-1]
MIGRKKCHLFLLPYGSFMVKPLRRCDRQPLPRSHPCPVRCPVPR